MNTYIDAHCHLCDGVPHGARDASGFICNTTCESQWDAMIGAHTKYSCLYPAIGIHPWYIDDVTPGWDTRLIEKIQVYSNLMIGEIGLDRSRPGIENQQDVFARQMEIAVLFHRPVHIHCVRAWDLILGQLKQMPLLPPVIVLHRFNANADITRKLMKYDNIYYSFAQHEPAATIVPKDRILVESDGVADIYLKNIIDNMAADRGENGDTWADVIHNNTMRVIQHG